MQMDSVGRLHCAVEGRTPDRVPVSVWYHFGSEHLPPPAVARLHAEYHAAYEWDFLKAMFDYRLEYPDAVDGAPALDLPLMLAATDWRAPFALQREVLVALRAHLGPRVPLVETIYSPWMYLLRHLGADRTDELLACPDLLTDILARLTEETVRHVREVAALGCYGIYFATLAAGMADGQAQQIHDREVLSQAGGMVRMLHLHGSRIDPGAVASYPREVLHSDNQDPGNPSLARLRAAGRCLMGGLPTALTGMSMQALRRHARDAIAEAGGAGFILAPGCSVSPSVSVRKLRALRDPSLLATSGSTASA